jgi:hypothetical protein
MDHYTASIESENKGLFPPLRLVNPACLRTESGKPVDALLIALMPVLVHFFLAHGARELQQLVALSPVLVQRHGETAGGHDGLDVEHDDLTLAWIGAKEKVHLFPCRVARTDNSAPSVEADDARLVLEAAEHQRQPPVFGDVRGCLILAAGQVEIGHALFVQDVETVTAFR